MTAAIKERSRLSARYVVLTAIGNLTEGAVVTGFDIAPLKKDDKGNVIWSEQDALANLDRLERLESVRPANEFEAQQDRVTLLKHDRTREESMSKLYQENKALKNKVSELEGEIFHLRTMVIPQAAAPSPAQEQNFAKLAAEKDAVSEDLRRLNSNLNAALAQEQQRVKALEGELMTLKAAIEKPRK